MARQLKLTVGCIPRPIGGIDKRRGYLCIFSYQIYGSLFKKCHKEGGRCLKII